MASIQQERGSLTTVLSTELNSLSNNAKVLSAAIDNSTALDFFDDLELDTGTFGGQPSAGAVVALYLLEALDDTNFVDGDASTLPASSDLIGHFNIRSSTAAQTHVVRGVHLPPTKFKYLILNLTGQSLNATGNTLRRRPSRYKSN